MEASREGEKSKSSGARRRARILAFRALYALDVDPEGTSLENQAARIMERSELRNDVKEFASSLMSLAATYSESIDQTLRAALSDGWSIKRLAATDRAVLRLAVTELMFSPQLATGIILDEAIEIAKRYGTPQSGKFVNGVLNQVALAERSAEQGTS